MTILHFHLTVESDKTPDAVAMYLRLLLDDDFPAATVDYEPLATTMFEQYPDAWLVSRPKP